MTSVVIVDMSGYTDQIIDSETAFGERRLLRKPFTEPELIKAVHDALRASQPEGAWL